MKLEQGLRVFFRISPEISGAGKVCGIATTDIWGIGKMVIVELVRSEGIDPATYPYTHIVVAENLLQEIREDEDEIEEE